MSDETPDKFAFGIGRSDGYSCPAVAAGKSVDGLVMEVAEAYDYMVQLGRGATSGGGVADYDEAKSAWEDAVDEYREKAEDVDDPRRKEVLESIVAEGEEVAEAVF